MGPRRDRVKRGEVDRERARHHEHPILYTNLLLQIEVWVLCSCRSLTALEDSHVHSSGQHGRRDPCLAPCTACLPLALQRKSVTRFRAACILLKVGGKKTKMFAKWTERWRVLAQKVLCDGGGILVPIDVGINKDAKSYYMYFVCEEKRKRRR